MYSLAGSGHLDHERLEAELDDHYDDEEAVVWQAALLGYVRRHESAPYRVWTDYMGQDLGRQEFEDMYEGHHDSEKAWAEQLLEDTGAYDELDRSDLPYKQWLKYDEDAMVNDCRLSGEYYFHRLEDGTVYVYRVV